MASIETNLNQSPFFDDYLEGKNFHRVLFRPGYAVQARELTQLQTILQKQVERFGDYVIDNGTVIDGCDVELQKWDYVKIQDKDANNRILLLTDFFDGGSIANCTVTGTTTGVTAKLLDAVDGSEGSAPNYLSVFVSYTNSGSNNTTKSFGDNETLIFRNSVGNTFIVAADTITSGSTGKGLGARASSGVVYHKGNFILSQNQSGVVSKYSTVPTIRVGFETIESVVDSNQDSSLLDNASGATNFTAPGASRLKISTKIKAKLPTDANTAAFFPIMDVEEGRVIRKTVGFSPLEIETANRTYEESGNYALDPFKVRVEEHLRTDVNGGVYGSLDEEVGDRNKLVVEVEPSIGYVRGFRTELIDLTRKTINKSTDFDVKEDVIVGQAYGNYVICNEVAGTFDFQGLRTVGLYDTAQSAITSVVHGTGSISGSLIGTARVRGFQYHSGASGTPSGQHRIYLFDIKMNTAKSFTEVKSLHMTNSGANGVADVVLENNVARVQDSDLSSLVFPLQNRGIKRLADASNAVQTQYVFRTEKSVTVQTDGTTIVAANTAHTGGTENNNDTGAPLTSVDEKNIIIVAKTAAQTTGMTGSASQAGSTITGSGTSFLSQYSVGDFIVVGSNPAQRITDVGDDTTITVSSSNSYATSLHAKAFPAGHIFDLSSNGTINSVSSQHSIDLGQANLNSTFVASVYFDVLRSNAVQANKTVLKDKYVHINTGSHPNGATGPYSLGVSDAYKVSAVYIGANTSVSTSDTDVTTQFSLDDGQRDSFYDTSSIIKNPTSALDLVDKGLLVKFSYFGRDRSAGIGFLTVDSYPIDDANPSGASNITTQEIPKYSGKTGPELDLRDSVDFRPIKNNTVVPSTTATAAAAPTNPVANTSFNVDGDGAYLPTPDQNFQADVQKYLSRIDIISLRPDGTINVTAGAPEEFPSPPQEDKNAMGLATVFIPPYPSLSSDAATYYNRPSYEVQVTQKDNKRFTMSDIRELEKEVKIHHDMIYLNKFEIEALKGSSLRPNDPVNCVEPPRDSIIVDPPAEPSIANTLRSSDLSFIQSPLRAIPTLQDIELQLQSGSVNVTEGTSKLTINETGYAFLINQRFATRARTVSVETTTPAKLYNGQMTLSHPVCNITQSGEPSPPPSAPVSGGGGSVSSGGAAYGIGGGYGSWSY